MFPSARAVASEARSSRRRAAVAGSRWPVDIRTSESNVPSSKAIEASQPAANNEAAETACPRTGFIDQEVSVKRTIATNGGCSVAGATAGTAGKAKQATRTAAREVVSESQVKRVHVMGAPPRRIRTH